MRPQANGRFVRLYPPPYDACSAHDARAILAPLAGRFVVVAGFGRAGLRGGAGALSRARAILWHGPARPLRRSRIEPLTMMSKAPLSTQMRPTEAGSVGRARFAIRAHGAQIRQYYGQPFVVHLDSVVRILQSFGIEAPSVLAAAYLHDTAEDTEASIADIFKAFGESPSSFIG
jgi:hypothetical protein